MSESRSLGEAIRLRRLELRMSQEELAERIGPDVRQSDVSRLERGKIVFPRLERLNQIAAALGMSIGTLLIESGWFHDEENAPDRYDGHNRPEMDQTIVIADDEPVILDAIASILCDSGYLATPAYDLDSLMKAIDGASPATVLVDIALPGLRLEEFVAQMTLRNPPPLLVFMGTGFSDPRVEGPYLEKPIDARQLLAFISTIPHQSSPGQDHSNGHLSIY